VIKHQLTAVEAAERLGVKPATLYSYVSRGVLQRQQTPEGSRFDPQEVARVARTGRPRRPVAAPGTDDDAVPPGVGGPGGPDPGPAANPRRRGVADDPVFVTAVTLIDGGRLYYRGEDAVELSRRCSFEAVAGWLWTGEWAPGRAATDGGWVAPARAAEAVDVALGGVDPGASPVERYMLAVAAAALTDDLRHDLSPAAVPIVGRSLIATLVGSLPTQQADPPTHGSISARLWPRLSPLLPTPVRLAVLEAALVLSADHELAPSTMAARVAAAFRADPYAVVSSGLGPASGSWYPGSTGAPGEVEDLLAETATQGAGRAVGARLRRAPGPVHGFGMPLYPAGDPRGAELLSRLDEIGGRPERHAAVRQVVQVGRARGFPEPNVDLGLGALAFCAEMVPGAGQAIATLGKVAGWLAHAIEEYVDPTRFRTRAAYIGPPPGAGNGDSAAGSDRPSSASGPSPSWLS
jgi:citrate synthase